MRRPGAVAWTFGMVLLFILLGLIVGRQAVASYLWERFRFPYASFVAPPPSASESFAIGQYFFAPAHHDLASAQYFFARAQMLDPSYPEANLELARIAFIRGYFFLAETDATRELALHPENATTYYLRGLIYGYDKQFSLAERDFLAFLQRQPESWAGHNDLAFVYFQEGKYQEAAAVAEDGLRYSAGNPWLHNALGVAQLNLGEKAQALNNFILARSEFKQMTPEQWGQAYPGNDPRLYAGGLASILASLEQNIALIQGTSTMHSAP